MQNTNGTNSGEVTRLSLPVANELNQAFFHYSPCGMAATDRTGRFVAANDAFCDLVGYSAAELAELTIADVTHPDDRDREAQPVDLFQLWFSLRVREALR